MKAWWLLQIENRRTMSVTSVTTRGHVGNDGRRIEEGESIGN